MGLIFTDFTTDFSVITIAPHSPGTTYARGCPHLPPPHTCGVHCAAWRTWNTGPAPLGGAWGRARLSVSTAPALAQHSPSMPPPQQAGRAGPPVPASQRRTQVCSGWQLPSWGHVDNGAQRTMLVTAPRPWEKSVPVRGPCCKKGETGQVGSGQREVSPVGHGDSRTRGLGKDGSSVLRVGPCGFSSIPQTQTKHPKYKATHVLQSPRLADGVVSRNLPGSPLLWPSPGSPPTPPGSPSCHPSVNPPHRLPSGEQVKSSVPRAQGRTSGRPTWEQARPGEQVQGKAVRRPAGCA